MTPVAADLMVAGGRISIESDVGADATLAGGAVDIRAPVNEDLRVAAGTVRVERNIGGDLMATGGTISVDSQAHVGGATRLAGGEIIVAGNIDRDAKIHGGKITLSGRIDGDTRLIGQEIVVAPTARFGGNLSYSSPTALPDNLRTQVSGTITRLETTDGWQVEQRGAGRVLSWLHPLFFVSMLVCGTLLYLLFPNAVNGVQRTIGEHPVRSLLIGLAMLFAIPPVTILLMVTVIGLPIGFALLLLYPLALLFGYLATAFFLGRKAALATKHAEPLSWKKQVLYLGLALLLLSLALAIPFIGPLVLMLAVIIGAGGCAIWAYQQYESPRPATG